MCHVWTAPCWQELFEVMHGLSVLPCVRPFDAALTHGGPKCSPRGRVPVKSRQSKSCPGTSGVSRSPDLPAWCIILLLPPPQMLAMVPCRPQLLTAICLPLVLFGACPFVAPKSCGEAGVQDA